MPLKGNLPKSLTFSTISCRTNSKLFYFWINIGQNFTTCGFQPRNLHKNFINVLAITQMLNHLVQDEITIKLAIHTQDLMSIN